MKKNRVSDSLTKSEHLHLISDLTDKLTLSELNTLLMEVFRQKSRKLRPSALLSNYQNNRFVRPSTLDPQKLMRTRLEILELAQTNGFTPLDLSPLTPFGCCSVLAPVDQNNIVTALRGTEVVSDATNVLALEASLLRESDPDKEIHLCCSHRAVRAQSFDNPYFSAHFELFCTVSAGRDNGNYTFEKSMIDKHLRFYLTMLGNMIPHKELSIILIHIPDKSETHNPFAAVSDFIKQSMVCCPVTVRESEGDFTYYKYLRFNILLHKHGTEHLIVDGGFTDWSQRLLNNRKERLLTSGLGVEYLLKIIND